VLEEEQTDVPPQGVVGLEILPDDVDPRVNLKVLLKDRVAESAIGKLLDKVRVPLARDRGLPVFKELIASVADGIDVAAEA